MSDYQVIARKFRPQTFKDVIGQDPIVTTLKNAIKFNRLAQAYLFCGSRGTGKTTLARILAKALNCQQLTTDLEPCNQCSSCREIASGSSLDVLEIDGASHRGIEDIRQINENVGYASASGQYKIYLIDEVHMLTKEAFNALLKTLEEPPPRVKFFFATTEPHKVLPTILSRCQRFNLSRIPLEKIQEKLHSISKQMGFEVEDEALRLLAQQAEGGLRDAESLLDQIFAFEEGKITANSVNAILGLTSRETYFELDRAGKEGNLAKAFEIAHYVFSHGKDLMHFVEGLIEHFRNILLIQLSGKGSPLLAIPASERDQYEAHARLYSQEQCLSLIDYLIQSQNQLRFSSNKMALEAILLHILRSHFRLPIELLVRRLSELEKQINEKGLNNPEPSPKLVQKSINTPEPSFETVLSSKTIPTAQVELKPFLQSTPHPAPVPIVKTPPIVNVAPVGSIKASPNPSISVDPTPTPADLGIKKSEQTKSTTQPQSLQSTKLTPIAEKKEPRPEIPLEKPNHYYDTLFHFAAVELEGKIKKNQL
ncbi:MAG: DNA polymerase III subunit gamma/tau [Parachlamydiaceae bacterium]|nr:DNA polymerase III subunit gamma/tau [Parachlamydiaceae bacterium]